jgi:glucosamine-6-phosphate deaminase
MDTYAEIAARVWKGDFDPSELTVFQLDEYVGVPPNDRRSLGRWLDRSFVVPLGLAEGQVVWLDPLVADLDAECRRYDEAIHARGLDLAILGLGPNGHLGFNEPPSPADAPTRVVALTPESVRSNAAYWGSEADVPRRAMTAGMAVLLAARRIVLVVAGGHKRDILRSVLHGPASPAVPASFLQRHADAVVVTDAAAAPN